MRRLDSRSPCFCSIRVEQTETQTDPLLCCLDAVMDGSGSGSGSDEDDQKCLPWHEMGLDDRILKAVAKLGWAEPTPIQERAIPLALEGKDLLARGRTGSGKTGAFAIPLLQRVLSAKAAGTGAGERAVRALVLAPSRELARQISGQLAALAGGCRRSVACLDLSPQVDLSAQAPLLREAPDVVVGTPFRVLAHLKETNMELRRSLEMLVIDEADLIFSFGHGDDVEGVLRHLPPVYQSILTSATLNEDVERLRRLGVLRNPVVLKLEEPRLPPESQLTQYQIKIEEEDKFVLVYALFKLKLVHGKSIVFVNSVDRCYKLKLYLEQFQVPVCVLNSELPAATRCHIVGQFNRGIYDVIVASDERFLDEGGVDEEAEEGEGEGGRRDKKGKKRKVDLDKVKSKRDKDKESGVARGIDFQFVSNVINFDFPPDADAYVHRVGRTARGNNRGTALSLVSGREVDRLHQLEAALKEQLGMADEEGDGEDKSVSVLKPYRFKMEELDGFRLVNSYPLFFLFFFLVCSEIFPIYLVQISSARRVALGDEDRCAGGAPEGDPAGDPQLDPAEGALRGQPEGRPAAPARPGAAHGARAAAPQDGARVHRTECSQEGLRQVQEEEAAGAKELRRRERTLPEGGCSVTGQEEI